MIIALVVIGWVVCGVLAYGNENADWYHDCTTKWTSISSDSGEMFPWGSIAFILGPLGLLFSFGSSGVFRHGIRLKYWETSGK